MAAGLANVTIKIGADTAEAVQNIGKVNKALGEQMTRSQKVGAGIKKAAVPAAAAFAVVTGAVVKFTNAAAEDHDAQVKLAGQLRRTAGASDAAVASAEQFVDKLSRQVAIADDELRPALGKLAGATGSVEAGQRQLAIAADIAAQAHVPLAKAANALAQADKGRFGQLQKLVPAIDNATLASKDQHKIIAEAARLTAGSGAEAANTYEGRQRKMAIAIGEAQEAIGAGFLPVLDQLLPVLEAATGFVTDHTDALTIAIGVVGGIAGTILVANAAMKAWEAVTMLAKVATTVWTGAQWLLNAALDANPIGLVVIAVAALTAGVILAYRQSGTFREVVNDLWAVLKQGITLYLTPLRLAFDAVRAAWELASEKLSGPVSHAATDAYKGAVELLKGAFDLARGAWNTAVAVFEAVVSTGPIGAVRTVVDLLRDAFAAAKGAWSTAVGVIEGAIEHGPIDLLKSAVDGLRAAFDLARGAWRAAVGVIESAISHGPIDLLKGAVDRLKGAFDTVAGAVQKVLDLIGKIHIPDLPSLPGLPFSLSSVAPAGRVTPLAAAAGAAPATIIVNVYGAIDPDATARQVRRILTGYDRRQGAIA